MALVEEGLNMEVEVRKKEDDVYRIQLRLLEIQLHLLEEEERYTSTPHTLPALTSTYMYHTPHTFTLYHTVTLSTLTHHTYSHILAHTPTHTLHTLTESCN